MHVTVMHSILCGVLWYHLIQSTITVVDYKHALKYISSPYTIAAYVYVQNNILHINMAFLISFLWSNCTHRNSTRKPSSLRKLNKKMCNLHLFISFNGKQRWPIGASSLIICGLQEEWVWTGAVDLDVFLPIFLWYLTSNNKYSLVNKAVSCTVCPFNRTLCYG